MLDYEIISIFTCIIFYDCVDKLKNENLILEMKRIFLYFLVVLDTVITSCSMFEGEEKSDYENIYYGLTIYSTVEEINNYAMDGVNVAMRLALLLNEMEAAGLTFDSESEPDWNQLGTIRYGGFDYNKKVFLFGNSTDVNISKSGDDYFVEYGTEGGLHTAGAYDNAYRIGEYRINTSGNNNIMNSSEDSHWSVSVNCDTISYSKTKNAVLARYQCSNANSELWHTKDGTFEYAVSDVAVLYNDGDFNDDNSDDGYEDSAWSNSGTISIDDFVAFTMSDTIGAKFGVTIDAAGGVALTSDEYSYTTSSPIIYHFLSGANLKYGGVENVHFIGTSNVLDSYDVTVETASNGLQTIFYNGFSYEYDDEYYFYSSYDSLREDEGNEEEDYLDQLDD